jgi:hypothetical protein
LCLRAVSTARANSGRAASCRSRFHELSNELPRPVEVVCDRLALGFQAEAALPLPIRADTIIRDEAPGGPWVHWKASEKAGLKL